MPPNPFWSRLRETRLVQALVVYLAAAWVTIQAVDLFSSAFEWPKWVMRGSIVLLAAGLVATLVLVWANTRAQARVAVAEGETPPRSRSLLAGAVAIALALVGAALFTVIRDRGGESGPDLALASAAPGVAILPFQVNDAELEGWREGLVDLLGKNLDGAGGLRAIDSRTVMARWREQVPEGREPDLPTALAVARSSGGRYALVGSVVSISSNMRIFADVYDLEEGDQLGQESVEGSPDSIFGLVDRLSIAVLRRILARDGGGELPRVDLASVTTNSVPALKAFLEGEALARRSEFELAIPVYEAAIAADSTFALAAFRLGQAHGWIRGLEDETADSLYQLASRFADRLPERDRDALATALAYTRKMPDATERARLLAQEYPDDPHAWFILGEVYFHLPYQMLVTREETAETFTRATRLDPTYTPAYIHLLDLAFMAADSARLAELIPRYDSLASGTTYDRRYEIAYQLAFGSPAVRERARAAMDSLPSQAAGPIVALLHHPRFLDLQAQVGLPIFERPESPPDSRTFLLFNLIERGKLREAETLLADPTIPVEPRVQATMFLEVLDAPVSEGFYGRVYEGGMEARDIRAFGAILLAIEEGRWGEYEAGLSGARQIKTQIEAAGDSATAREIDAAIDVLRGRAAMVRGQHAAALELMENAFRRSGIPIVVPWIAELHADAGREAEAVRYLETIGPDPWAGLRLGPLYTELGEREKAIEAYRWVTLAWDEADPTLQPDVARARSAIASLSGLRRG
jgi:tetratricopeptide (TPR) repeat protein